MISVSYLKSKYSKKETLDLIEQSESLFIHVDLMDGVYVPNKNFETKEVIDDLMGRTKPLDIHLMVNDPENYIEELSVLNPSIITFHLDATRDPRKVIDLIKSLNIKVGVALNPNEDVDILNEYMDEIDYVLIMSVYPGKGGQTFIEDVLTKIDDIKKYGKLVGIDGGINDQTITRLKKYHLDNIISGSYICMSDDIIKQVHDLKRILEEN